MTSLSLNFLQTQSLCLTHEMQQAIKILEMPIEDLSSWIDQQVEKNPLLRKKYDESKLFQYSPSTTIIEDKTLYSHLIEQARVEFTSAQFTIAERLIGHIDNKGFIQESLDEMFDQVNDQQEAKKVLSKLQQLDPIGVGAKNAQEALLIQLSEKKSSLAYKIIKHHFILFTNNQLNKIAHREKVHIDAITKSIEKEIKPLNPFPGLQFNTTYNPPIRAEISISYENGKWTGSFEQLPPFELQAVTTPNSLEKFYSKEGKWLIHSLKTRMQIITKITHYIISQQYQYLLGQSNQLKPIQMQEAAASLGLSNSTLSRAVNSKYLDTPLGLLPFKHFFTHSSSTSRAKTLLQELIKQENKQKPLSDEILALLLSKQGIKCSRRVITKYRHHLNILSSSQRRQFIPNSH